VTQSARNNEADPDVDQPPHLNPTKNLPVLSDHVASEKLAATRSPLLSTVSVSTSPVQTPVTAVPVPFWMWAVALGLSLVLVALAVIALLRQS
jgi:hypothetical protein